MINGSPGERVKVLTVDQPQRREFRHPNERRTTFCWRTTPDSHGMVQVPVQPAGSSPFPTVAKGPVTVANFPLAVETVCKRFVIDVDH
jgi:hypothetical protein